MPNQTYNYDELSTTLYKRLKDFFQHPNAEKNKKNKSDFEIHLLAPFQTGERSQKQTEFYNSIENDNKYLFLATPTGVRAPHFAVKDEYGYRDTLERIPNLGDVWLPFDSRLDNPSFEAFTEAIKNDASRWNYITREEFNKDEAKYFTRYFEKQQCEKGIDVLIQYFNGKYSGSDILANDTLLHEAVMNVLLARIKMAYEGLKKEQYVKLMLLTHDKVCSGEWHVYETNSAGDKIGIDFFVVDDTQPNPWKSIAVTNPTKTNTLCDIRLNESRDWRKYKESWIYLPEDFDRQVADVIESAFQKDDAA
ncbi:hypothetical protein [Paenibacillus sp. Soil787]|uniref:hypothetical protein n=1 Tax=Paenibacillus sp. Soil787 TaxID=1736411 RepID=UPI0007002C89|nr:hypothetical protein [Paenibacillus sp. Soil787]KRF31671.1 hypothetical protein ASG93_04855 [Paenibacillus sp. Soil787]